MKISRLIQCALALAPAILFLAQSARAGERLSAPPIVSHYCSGCHEMDGRSQLPFIPRLAGLSAAYSERKLASFRNAPTAPVDEAVGRIVHFWGQEPALTRAAKANMVGVAHAISDDECKAALAWYAAQTPAPPKSRKSKLVEEGRSLFLDGLQSRGLPACQTCHGPDAQGTRIAPRLAGQNAGYVVSQLAFFRSGDPHHSPEMTAVAKNLERDQARAVAEYLQSH